MRSRSLMMILIAAGLVALSCSGGHEAASPLKVQDHAARWDPFLDTLQERTLHFFLETTPPNGLAYDRWPSRSPSSIGAVGFALTCYPIAVERGLIARADAARRVAFSLRFLYRLPYRQ